MVYIDGLFSLSLFFNALLFIPQALHILRKKSAYGLSLYTFLGFNVMQLLAILHGYLHHDIVLMVGFLISFITCGWVSYLVWNYQD